MSPGRDRDASGRPRNARPRDALGRPLPREEPARPLPVLPAEPDPDPELTAEARAAADLAFPPASALALAQRLLDAGRPFTAHEVLEASWKAAPEPERELWRGLAQIAVGITHNRRGNVRGATALLRRGAQRVSRYADGAPHGIDAAGVAASAERLAVAIERGVVDPSPAEPAIRLTVPPAGGAWAHE